ncbi:MAG TPA: TlpA disulfide reductase family protein [Bacteroidota bacterium]|nr:TlpA disulfide reductase family protein [Bacteroidota bacterium]
MFLNISGNSFDPWTSPSTTEPRMPLFQRSKRDSLKIGDEAPSFALRHLLSDEPTFLRDYTGKTLRDAKNVRHAVVISFWATWCQPCKVEIPLLAKMSEEFKDQPVKIFLINTREQSGITEDSVRAAFRSRGYTLPCLIDATGRVADNYMVRGLPMIVVIDKFGTVRKVNRGFHENFHIEIANLLKTLVKEDSTSYK